MKRLIFTVLCAVTLLSSSSLYAQGFSDIYLKYKTEQDITAMEVNQPGMVLTAMTGKQLDADEAALLNKAEAVSLLVAQNTAFNKMDDDINKYIKKNKLDKLVDVVDPNNQGNVKAYALNKSNIVEQILVLAETNGQKIVIYIDGKFPMEEIQKVIAKNSKTVSNIK